MKDTATKNALTRFESSLTKKFSAQLENFNEQEFREIQEMKDLFDFLDQVESDGEEEIPLDPPKRAGSKVSAR